MEERLKNYLAELEKASTQLCQEKDETIKAQKRKQILEDLLIQIGFFQHERLVHLIVTVIFALLTMLTMLGVLLMPQIALFLLMALFLVLLIPYVRHYYILENGVQKLYRYYDKIRDC